MQRMAGAKDMIASVIVAARSHQSVRGMPGSKGEEDVADGGTAAVAERLVVAS